MLLDWDLNNLKLWKKGGMIAAKWKQLSIGYIYIVLQTIDDILWKDDIIYKQSNIIKLENDCNSFLSVYILYIFL